MRQKVQNFTDLTAWKESHDLVLTVYETVKSFPKREEYGLKSQMCRAAVSVPSNIAEGFNRLSQQEKIRFYNVALGWVSELQAQLLIVKDIGFVTDSDTRKLLEQTETVRKLLSGLIKSIKA